MVDFFIGEMYDRVIQHMQRYIRTIAHQKTERLHNSGYVNEGGT